MNVSRAFRVITILVFVAVLVLQPLAAPVMAAQPNRVVDANPAAQAELQAAPTDQVIVKFRDSDGSRRNGEAGRAAFDAQAQVDRLSQAAGVNLAYVREMSGEAHIYRMPQVALQPDLDAIIANLEALPEVLYAEPDAIMLPTLVPNDPQYGSQWHYKAPSPGNYGINLPAAWDITTGNTTTVVAVIDSGITVHPDLAGRTVPGYDFINTPFNANDGDARDADPADPGDWNTINQCYSGSPARNSSWHGTHVAGTIAANSNNAAGVAGVNWNAKILPVRALGRCGGYTSDIADGMRWAAGLAVAGVPLNTNPAKVLNLSLGGSGSCAVTYQNAINDITAAGKTVVVAAGNSNANTSGFQPANCDNVITVSATNRDGSRAYYSNYGDKVEISAPGGETDIFSSDGVLSTLNSGATVPATPNYVYYQGTSMATPHVAGVISLMYALNPSLTPAQVRTYLQASVTPFPGGSTCTTANCGSGIVNAAAALQMVADPPEVCTNLLKDPGFEAYTPNPHWTETSSNFDTPLCNETDCGFSDGTAGPRTGNVWGWFGGTDFAETASLQQAVVIPPGNARLEFFLWIGRANTGASAADVFRARMDGNSIFSVNATQIASYNSYKKVTLNVSSYANDASHTLRFESVTDGQIINFNLDDVLLCILPPDYPVYLPIARR